MSNEKKMYASEMWQEPLLRPYLGEVRRKFGVVETLALPSLRDLPAVQIETLFVSPLLCSATVNADDDPKEWPEGRSLFSELQDCKQLVVLGDPGGGKTTLGNWLAWRLASGAFAPLPAVLENKLPFPCVLRELPSACFENGFSVSDLAVAVVRKLLGDSKALQVSDIVRHWVDSGKYALILDGIDEIAVSRRPIIGSWIREVNRQGAVVLATSRVVGYEDYPVDSESASSEQLGNNLVLDLEKPRASELLKRTRNLLAHGQNSSPVKRKEWAKLRYLMPFNHVQISDFARNWYSQRCINALEAKQRTSDLLISLAQSEVTEKLARTPNLLSLMAIVHRERAHLPDGKALLYEEIVNAYLNTIDTHRKIEGEASISQFGWKERKAWLAYVGFKLQESRDWNSASSGILVSEEKVIDWLEEVMKETGVEDYPSIAREFLGWVARRSGLLLPRGENKYAFVHLSFQEYFCANFLASNIVRPAFVKGKLPARSPITKAKVTAWAKNPAWLETYIFLFETLSAEHGVDWVEALIEIVFKGSGGVLINLAARLVKNKHVRLPSGMRDFLAEGCVPAMFREADYNQSLDSDIFRILLDAGYAVHISGSEVDYAEFEKSEALFSKVKILIVSNGAIVTAELLSKFKSLLALSVNEGSVDLVGLNRNSELGWLRLNEAGVTGFEELKYLTGLTCLELRRIDVDSLSPLAFLKNIKLLEISELPIHDLAPLINLSEVSYLKISWVKVSDLKPLANMRLLETLHLVGLPAKSFEFVKGLTSLEYVQIYDMSVDDFSYFECCKKIETLDLFSLDYADLSPFSSLPKIDAIFLSKIKECDLSPVASMTNLSIFMVEDMPVVNLISLSQCRKLYSVYLKGVDFSEIESVEFLKKIRAFTLNNVSGVKSFEFLKSFKSLRYLDLRGTNVSDLSFLAKHRAPFNLYLSKDHGLEIDFLLEKDGFIVRVEDTGDDEF